MEPRLLLAAAIYWVNTVADDGPGSLRWAIGRVNAEGDADDGPSTIRFALSGDGPATIRPLSPLDPIARPVFIEARAADGSPTIRIDGSAAGRGADGLIAAGGGSVLAGLIVTGFSGTGIVLTGAGGDHVESCYVGLVPGAGGESPTSAPNGTGIRIVSASSQTIGGPDGRGNVIAANLGAGIVVASAERGDAADDAIVGNWIGTDSSGTTGIGNGGDGVILVGAIRGRVEANVVSGNQGSGIVLSDRAEGNLVVGNVVGLTPDGTETLGNRLDGIVADDAPDNVVGGPLGNRISGNGRHGIRVTGESSGLAIRGNWIGVDPTGRIRQGNRADGVRLESDGVMVGGPDALDGNAIAFNGEGTVGAGVQLAGMVRGNAILSNRIYGNAGMGINLGNGPTFPHVPPISPPAEAIGPNDWVNEPILDESFADGAATRAEGRVWGMPGRNYVVQFFWTAAPDPSGHGEGERYLGQTTVTTDAKGEGAFSVPMENDAIGGFLSATSTDEFGNTSEFSWTTLLRPYTDLRVEMTANPPLGPRGSPVTFTATISNRGVLAAPGTALTISLPMGSRVAEASPGGSTGNPIRWEVGSLAPGASVVLFVTATPPAGVSGVFRAFASASMAIADSRPGDETAWASSLQAPPASSNLGVAASVDAATVEPGANAVFRFRGRNEGPSTEPGASMTLAIPAGATLVSATSDRGETTIADGRITIRAGALAAGEEFEATVVLTSSTPGTLEVSATVAGLNPDDDPSNQRATASATVSEPVDLATWIDPPAAVFERAEFRYVVTIANRSNRDATGARLVAPLPAGVEFVSAVAGRGASPTFNGREIVAEPGTVAAGDRVDVTITVRVAAAAGTTLLLSGVSTSDLPDSSADNDRGGFAVTVRPAVDLALGLWPASPSVDLGDDVAWTAEVRNDGPTTATGVRFAIPRPAGGAFESARSSRGIAVASDGGLTVDVGALAPGESATIAFVLRPTVVGALAVTASVVADQHVNATATGTATARLTVTEPAGTIAFASPTVAVPETAGLAYMTIVRTDGARGAVSVRYRTTVGSAVADVDYRPASGIVTLQPGQTFALIAIPVLPYAHNRGDAAVGVVLEDPTGGARMGTTTTASLAILDVDPDFSPPSVDRVRLLGSASLIGGIAISMSEPADPASAMDARAYALLDLGPAGILGDGDDAPVLLAAPGYDAATQTILLMPVVPLATNRHYALVVRGAGPSGVVDLAGNPLGGGVDFVGLFARGTSLKYADATGDVVTLSLRNGGFLDLARAASGDAIGVTLHDIVPGRSSLVGSIARQRGRGDGVTPLGTIEGLGAFGDVRVGLRTPPFLTTSFPARPSRTQPEPTPVPIRRPVPMRGRVVAPSRRLPRWR